MWSAVVCSTRKSCPLATKPDGGRLDIGVAVDGLGGPTCTRNLRNADSEIRLAIGLFPRHLRITVRYRTWQKIPATAYLSEIEFDSSAWQISSVFPTKHYPPSGGSIREPTELCN